MLSFFVIWRCSFGAQTQPQIKIALISNKHPFIFCFAQAYFQMQVWKKSINLLPLSFSFYFYGSFWPFQFQQAHQGSSQIQQTFEIRMFGLKLFGLVCSVCQIVRFEILLASLDRLIYNLYIYIYNMVQTSETEQTKPNV